MNRLKHIVIGADFSEQSRNALTEAARIADWNEAKLRLAHVVEAEAVRHLARHEGRDVEEIRAELTELSQETLKKWSGALDVPARVSMRVLYGHATDEVLKQVKEVNAGLLVAGVRGQAGDSPGAGAQATRLVRTSPCDVLLVDEGHDGPFKRVVAAIDFSPTSRVVAEQALRLAEQDGGEVCFVHVYAAPWRNLHLPTAREYSSAFRAGYLSDLEGELRSFVGNVGDVRASYHLHHNQKHGRGINEFARERDADLLVLGTQGRFNLRYMLLGSTAEYLLRQQPCSVLAVRPPK